MKLFPTYKNLNQVILNKKNLLDNISYIKNLHQSKNIIAVIKSNAYGHGLKEIGHLLEKNKNINILAVDSLYEAYELKKEKIKKEILILGYTNLDNLRIKKLPFSFVVSDIDTLQTLNKYQKGVKIHIEIDTGMNRLGVKYLDIPKFIKVLKECKNIKIEGIMSHFSSADDYKSKDITDEQIQLFKKSIAYFEIEGFKFKYIHISASAGLLDIKDDFSNTVRTGIGMYGISPFNENNKKLHPVMELISHISQIKDVKKGECIGYSRTYEASEDMRIAILPLGYSDGFDRRLSNIGYVKIGNEFCRIVGQISMNLSAIDITHIQNPHIGTEVIIYSNTPTDPNSIKNTANLIDSIQYAVLTGINPTIKKKVI